MKAYNMDQEVSILCNNIQKTSTRKWKYKMKVQKTFFIPKIRFLLKLDSTLRNRSNRCSFSPQVTFVRTSTETNPRHRSVMQTRCDSSQAKTKNEKNDRTRTQIATFSRVQCAYIIFIRFSTKGRPNPGFIELSDGTSDSQNSSCFSPDRAAPPKGLFRSLFGEEILAVNSTVPKTLSPLARHYSRLARDLVIGLVRV
ncbi:uncharacterized protein LOC128891969 [Hylaeus anthracinus]|uniref:uncharacterized protein LOC128891969 n=1 Tax=Hylaeus anthracinus TaxID=313031 RepID=UPI0023B9D794|nr:uncharacterized protein LOC128891969 [Hylaeus anthracinus]